MSELPRDKSHVDLETKRKAMSLNRQQVRSEGMEAGSDRTLPPGEQEKAHLESRLNVVIGLIQRLQAKLNLPVDSETDLHQLDLNTLKAKKDELVKTFRDNSAK